MLNLFTRRREFESKQLVNGNVESFTKDVYRGDGWVTNTALYSCDLRVVYVSIQGELFHRQSLRLAKFSHPFTKRYTEPLIVGIVHRLKVCELFRKLYGTYAIRNYICNSHNQNLFMKRTLMICTFLLCTLLSQSQKLMRMEDNVYALFTLNETSSLNFNKISYNDPLYEKPSKYYAKLKFGKGYFNIGFFQTGSGKFAGAHSLVLQDGEFFQLVKKDEYEECYEFKRVSGLKIEWYKVRFSDVLRTVNVFYSVSTNGGKTYPPIYSGRGEF